MPFALTTVFSGADSWSHSPPTHHLPPKELRGHFLTGRGEGGKVASCSGARFCNCLVTFLSPGFLVL